MNEEKMIYNLIRDFAKVVRSFQSDTVFCEGITYSQFNILDLVNEKKSMELSELHNLLSVEKSTTTRLVEPLIRKGYLTKVKSGNDSRVIEVHITGTGIEIHNKVWMCISGNIKGIINLIPEEKRSETMKCLYSFINAFKNCC